jgi:hypothetical protein
MRIAGAAWLGVTGLGLILLFSGITDSGGNSQPGLIVFGALIVSMGVSGMLGVAHDPYSSGSMFAMIGFIIPAYSLPFLLYYASKGASDRAKDKARRDRVLAGERAERETGLRCPHCGLLDESGRHDRRCPDYVHEVEVVGRSPQPQLLCALLVRARDEQARVGGGRSRNVQDLPRGHSRSQSRTGSTRLDNPREAQRDSSFRRSTPSRRFLGLRGL